MKLHHFGFLTDNIKNSIKQYELLGYKATESYFDELRMINIVFMKQVNNTVSIELVEPADNKSIVNKLLDKYRNNLYHSCYEVEDLDTQIKNLCENYFILIDPPKEAIAFQNRKVAFLMSKHTGIIELLESKK